MWLIIGVLFALLWLGIYRLLQKRLLPQKSNEFNCRVICLIHAVVVILISIVSALIIGPWPLSNFAGQSSFTESVCLTVSVGFFIFDLIWCIKHPGDGYVMLAHHCCALLFLSITLVRGIAGSETMGVLFGAEASNPFLQLRWFLRDMNVSHTTLAVIVDILFIGTFVFMRVILGTFMMIKFTFHSKSAYYMKMGGIGFYFISWIFLYNIYKFARKRFSTPKITSNFPNSQIINQRVSHAVVS